MTVLDVALTAPEIALAAGAHTVRTWMHVVSRTSFATARINDSSFTYPESSITVDGVSAGWTSATKGQTLLVGTTAGASDIAILRLRATPGATTAPIMETSEGDPGLIPGGIRTAAFADNQYLTVVDQWNIFSILPLITGGNIYEDLSIAPYTLNTNPPPLVSVTINGEHNHYAGFTDAGQTYCTMVFTASATLWPTSASATYSWVAPASWGAAVAGATNTNTVTFRVPRSTTNYVMRLTVAENTVSQPQERKIMVWSCDRTGTYAPLPISDMSGDSWDQTGARFNFTLNDNLLASIPDGAMVHVFSEALFNGTAIASAVTRFTGWLVRANKHGEPGLRSADCEFIGVAGLLAFRRGTSQIIEAVESPATWQEVPASLCSMSFLQWWLLKNRASNVLDLFDVNVYSTSPTGQSLPSIVVNAGNLWQQVSSLADGIMKRTAGADPDGTLWLGQPNPVVTTSYGNRVNIVKRDTLTESIITSGDLPREFIPQCGQVEGEAFSWGGILGTQPTPYLSIAPGNAPGQGASDQKVQNQLVAEQADLNLITGMTYAALNPDYGEGSLTIQSNRGALYKPAQGQMARLTIAAAYNADGVAFDRYIIVKSVNRSFQRTGDGGSVTVETTLNFIVETAGVAGVTVPVPVENANLYSSESTFAWTPTFTLTEAGLTTSQISPKALATPSGKVAKLDGNELLIWNATKIYYLKNVVNLTTPQYVNITPTLGAFTVRQCVIDPLYNASTAIPAYALVSDGTDSKVLYCSNIAAANASTLWVAGTAYAGTYTTIRASNVAGDVLIGTAGTDAAWSHTGDLTATPGGFTQVPNADGTRGTWTLATGWASECHNNGFGEGFDYVQIAITLPANTPLTKVSMTYDLTIVSSDITNFPVSPIQVDSTGVVTTASIATQTQGTAVVKTWTGSMTGTTVYLTVYTGSKTAGCPTGGTGVITSYTIEGEGVDPFGGAGNSAVRYSANYGSTFAAAVVVGTSGGADMAMDIQRSGPVSYAASAGKVRKATTLGGAYSDWFAMPSGEASSIIIPYYKRNSTTINTSTSTPDAVVLATDGKMYWIDGAAATATTITPTGSTAAVGANSVTTTFGHHIAAYCSVSGAFHLFTSTNGGSTWSDRGAVTNPTWLRTRRNDSRGSASGSNLGQLYLAVNGTLNYSSKWFSAGLWPRNVPISLVGFDTIF